MASENQARLKNITIKTGSVKRLAKEERYYVDEAEKGQKKLEEMEKDETKDEYDIKKQKELIGESHMMIRDCKRKLGTAYEELSKLIEPGSDLADTEQYKAAEKVLSDTKDQVESS